MIKRLRLVALGAALVYFFDPDNGKHRRKVTIKRLGELLRREKRKTAGLAEPAYAVKQQAHVREESKPQPDDVTLARKVESEIFRDADVPEGKVNVDAEDGRVVLRGEVDSPELIEELVGKARKVQGVQDVESLLHTPGEPASASPS
jgi:hypothetical protein